HGKAVGVSESGLWIEGRRRATAGPICGPHAQFSKLAERKLLMAKQLQFLTFRAEEGPERALPLLIPAVVHRTNNGRSPQQQHQGRVRRSLNGATLNGPCRRTNVAKADGSLRERNAVSSCASDRCASAVTSSERRTQRPSCSPAR